MPIAPKLPDYFDDIFLTKAILRTFEWELFIKTLSTTLIEIVCELMLYSEVIFTSMTGPDDTC